MTLGVWEAARLAQRSLQVKLAMEIESSPLAVYRDNFGIDDNVARQEDVSEVFCSEIGTRLVAGERCLRKQLKGVDFLLAGPPCQGHSDLNNWTRRSDPRNRYYVTTMRAVEVIRPRFVIVENVPTVVHDRNGVVDVAENFLGTCGYQVHTSVFSLSALGLPQRRRRHLLIAAKGELPEFSDSIVDVPSESAVGNFIDGLEDHPDSREGVFHQTAKMTSENRERVAWLFENDEYDLPNELRPSCHKNKEHSYVSMYGRLRWDKPAQTITTGFGSMGQGRFVHPTRKRTITPHEAARIQGFPDFFSFGAAKNVTPLRQMIGNAVPPQLTLQIALKLLKQAAG